jgi:hypothetical protein
VDYIEYSNDGAIRNLPLSDRLLDALSYLDDMGVKARVFSGGQPAKGSGGRRTGSTRHDHGNAADVFFYKDGRKLNWANPEDRPIFQEIVRRGKQAGLTGFGAGPGYMPEGSMHLGFGTPAVWGDNGSSRNTPGWLREAYNTPGQAGEGPVVSTRGRAGLAPDRSLRPDERPFGDAGSDPLGMIGGVKPGGGLYQGLNASGRAHAANPEYSDYSQLFREYRFDPPSDDWTRVGERNGRPVYAAPDYARDESGNYINVSSQGARELAAQRGSLIPTRDEYRSLYEKADTVAMPTSGDFGLAGGEGTSADYTPMADARVREAGLDAGDPVVHGKEFYTSDPVMPSAQPTPARDTPSTPDLPSVAPQEVSPDPAPKPTSTPDAEADADAQAGLDLGLEDVKTPTLADEAVEAGTGKRADSQPASDIDIDLDDVKMMEAGAAEAAASEAAASEAAASKTSPPEGIGLDAEDPSVPGVTAGADQIGLGLNAGPMAPEPPDGSTVDMAAASSDPSASMSRSAPAKPPRPGNLAAGIGDDGASPDQSTPAPSMSSGSGASSPPDGLPNEGQVREYIRASARANGIDPDVAVRVAESEGLYADPAEAFQSDIMEGGRREPSYGPFQLYTGGGLGNEFEQQTGLKASDPSNWRETVDFALSRAKETGWTPWYGAEKAGISPRQGIGVEADPSALSAVRSTTPTGAAASTAGQRTANAGATVPSSANAGLGAGAASAAGARGGADPAYYPLTNINPDDGGRLAASDTGLDREAALIQESQGDSGGLFAGLGDGLGGSGFGSSMWLINNGLRLMNEGL